MALSGAVTSLLHVGEDAELVREASTVLSTGSHEVSVVSTDQRANVEQRLDDGNVDCLVCEQGFADGSASELLGDVRENYPELASLYLAENTDGVNAALEAGASDVLVSRETVDTTALLARRLEHVLRGRIGGGEPDAETQLRRERDFSDLLLDTLDDVFYLVDTAGNLERWNESFREVTGYNEAELDGMAALDFFEGEDAERVGDAIAETLETGSSTVEAAFVTRDGETIPYQFSGAKLADDDGTVRGLVGIGRDVSKRNERLEKLDQIRQSVSEVVWMTTPEKRSMDFISDSYEEVWGRSPESLVEDPTSFVEAIHPDDRDRVKTALDEQIDDPDEYEETYRVVKPEGEVRWIHDRSSAVREDGEVTRIVGIARDITEHKELEQKLREKASLLDHIFDQIPTALYVKDTEARHIRMSDYDRDPAHVDGKADPEIYGESEFSQQTYADDMRVIEEGERIINQEEYNPENGEWTLTSKVPWHDEDGDIQGLIGVSRLITEKKEYEEELAVKNRAMAEAPVGITIHDGTTEDSPITYANGAFQALTGYDQATVDGQTFELLSGPDTDPEEFATIETAFDRVELASTVTLLYKADGTPFWGRVTVAPVTDESGAVGHFVGFLQDVTETKEHAEEIERRLDEFGEVLAEELRTPLQRAEETIQSLDSDGVDEELAAAERSVQQVDKLIDDLVTVHSFSVKSRDLFETATAEEGEQ